MHAQSCPTLCDPKDSSPPGSSVHGISQARIMEWVAISPSRDLPGPGIKRGFLGSPALAAGFFTTGATWETQVKRNLEGINANRLLKRDSVSQTGSTLPHPSAS